MGGIATTAGHRLARLVPLSARKRITRRIPRRIVSWYRQARVDAYLVSFPKCGRTWLRVMVGRALETHFDLHDELGIVELHRLAELKPGVPCIVATHDFAMIAQPEDLQGVTDQYQGRAAVLLVRDPRDAIISLYYHRKGRHLPYDGTLSEFLDEPVGGFDTIMAFYDAWAARLDEPGARTHVVRYEDLHTDPHGELRKVLRFVGVEVGDAVLEDAVQFGAFDNMRQLEESDALGTDKLRPGTRGDYTTYKTRKGMVGGFQDELTADEIAGLNHRMARSQAHRFGYDGDSA